MIDNPFVSHSEARVDEYIEQTKKTFDSGLNKLINEVKNKANENLGKFLNPQKHLIKGLPQKEILILANKLKVDLVVMGTVARTEISGFYIDNTAETILSQIKCSVLVIKPSEFVSPVTLD